MSRLRKLRRSLVILFRILFLILTIPWNNTTSLSIGSSESGKILVVAHTDDGELIRIISAREVTHGERKSYEES